MAVTFPDDADGSDPRVKIPPAMRAAIEATIGSARRAAADMAATLASIEQMQQAIRSAMLPNQKEFERLAAGLMPARQFSEMLAAALRTNVAQIEATNAQFAQLVRSDLDRMLPATGVIPAKLVIPHLEDMLDAARIAREVSGGSYESALAALQSLEIGVGGDLDEELEALLRDGGLLEGAQREQALADAADIADLAQQSGASVLDKQQLIAWLTKALAHAKDLFTAERITLILTMIAVSMQWNDQGQVEEKITQLQQKVDEGIRQQHTDQQETNQILRRVEELLEDQLDSDTDDESDERGQP